MPSPIRRLCMLVVSVSVGVAPLFPALAGIGPRPASGAAGEACCCGVASRCAGMACCGQQAPGNSTAAGKGTVVPALELATADTSRYVAVDAAAKRFAGAKVWLSPVLHTSTLLDQQVRLQL